MGVLVTIMAAGKAFFACGNHRSTITGVGPAYITGSPNVFCHNLPVVRLGDIHSDSCGHTSVAIAGSGTVFVNGLPIHRLNDATNKGFSTVPGQGDVFSG
jgi:uncharacterized Zn-binding protein involved in type VI secretion